LPQGRYPSGCTTGNVSRIREGGKRIDQRQRGTNRGLLEDAHEGEAANSLNAGSLLQQIEMDQRLTIHQQGIPGLQQAEAVTTILSSDQTLSQSL